MSYSKQDFAVEAQPGTDIWKKPPTTDIFNAPIPEGSTGPLQTFKSASVTFWSKWTERYDQGGILLTLSKGSKAVIPPQKWIKTGVEYYQDKPQLSTVGCDRFADWSIGPITTKIDETKGLTLLVQREGDENGISAWVYQLVLDGNGKETERIPLREITWIFADEKTEEWTLGVYPLVARPATTTADTLKVDFKDFQVKWA